MASKESTGLQAALIVFVLITVGLGIWVFVAQTQVTKLKQSQKESEDVTISTGARASFLDQQVKYLLHTTGFEKMEEADVEAAFKAMEGIVKDPDTRKNGSRFEPNLTQMQEVRKEFEEDIGRVRIVGGPDKGDYQHWRNLNDYYEELVKHKAQVAQQDVQSSKKDKTLAEEARDTAIAEQQRLDTDLKAERAKVAQIDTNFQTAKADFTAKTSEIGQLAKNKDNKYNADTRNLTTQIKDRNSRIQTLEQTNQALIARVTEMRTPDFDQPDGRITWVNQRSRTVWINLGLADGLYRQTTFSVFDNSDGSFARGQTQARTSDDDQDNKEFNIEDYAKAKIEVTRIIDRNSAEARIVSDDVSNPILPGDVIYTPAWTPGQTVKFALAGFMDYNGDGKSDREMIKNLITVSGGEIVCEVTDNGDFVGDVSLDTRYLVLGERPTAKPSDAGLLKNYGKMIGLAEDYGIEKIEFKKFLGFMGYKAEVQTVPLGRGGGGSSEFRSRRPPERGASGGAY